MKVISKTFPELRKCNLYFLGDVHCGNEYHNESLTREAVERIKEDPTAKVALCGDLLEMATKSSVSDVYKATDPMTQIEAVVSLLEPIKDKIVFMTNGNHEDRAQRDEGIDVTKLVAMQFGIVDLYAPNGGVLILRVGDGGSHGQPVCYTVYITHGTGGGSKAGGKINRVVNLSEIVDADVYVHGHTHLPAVLRQGFYRVDVHNNSVSYVDKLFVNIASMLNYGGYGQRKCYTPTSNINPVLCFDGARKSVVATL